MSIDLIPRGFFGMPSRLPSLFDEDEWTSFLPSSGLSVSEDDKHVYIEAAVPGLDAEKIEVTYEKGILWIRGNQEEQEENKQKKYYRKASSSFSYRVAVPGEIDETEEPKASYKNGIMKVIFNKLVKTEPKKLKITTE